MNIYLVNWVYDQGFNLSAVVVADNTENCLSQLELDPKCDSEIEVELMGVCVSKDQKQEVLCRESL